VNTTISQKRDAQGAGHQSEKTAMAVRAVAAATVEARAMVAAMTKEGGSVGRYVKQGEEGL